MPAQLQIQVVADTAQATAALQAVDRAAALTATRGVATLTQSAQGLRHAAGALSGTLLLIGGQRFPELTAAALTATHAVHGVRLAAQALGMSLAKAAPIVTAFVWGLYQIGKFAYNNVAIWKDLAEEERTRKEAMESAAENMARAYEMAIQAVTEGRLTLSEEEQKLLDNLAAKPTPENLKTFQKFLRERLPPGEFMTDAERAKVVREREEALDLSRRAADATLEYLHAAIPLEERRLMVERAYSDQVAMLRQLQGQGYLTEAAARNKLMEAEIEHHRALIGLRHEEAAQVQSDWRLTEAQRWQRLNALGVQGIGPNPESFSEQMRYGFVRMLDDIGTAAQNAAATSPPPRRSPSPSAASTPPTCAPATRSGLTPTPSRMPPAA